MCHYEIGSDYRGAGERLSGFDSSRGRRLSTDRDEYSDPRTGVQDGQGETRGQVAASRQCEWLLRGKEGEERYF